MGNLGDRGTISQVSGMGIPKSQSHRHPFPRTSAVIASSSAITLHIYSQSTESGNEKPSHGQIRNAYLLKPEMGE